jgi:branched-chain amino acid transport system permease protein
MDRWWHLRDCGRVFLVMDVQMLEPRWASRMLLPMFAAAILGGSWPYGAVFGGLVGPRKNCPPTWIGDTPLLSPGYKTGVAFAIMVLC